ncbi:hypothetical protein GLW03_13390 [Halobacillus halophilus]|uniref:hypothetical protein n=1 Tax=Halobacillus halophilus TaxID=1570 RepID=UPI00136B69AC|nr:hypothetical protein [Halobacillus halophilus]MYL30805.1 hypothetical protein [Halobacillus halophilus]
MGRRSLLVICVLGYVLMLHIVYIEVINPEFYYFGYIYIPMSGMQWAFSLTLTSLGTILMPVSVSRPSQVVVWLLFLIVVVPCNFVPYYTLGHVDFSIYFFQIILFFSLFILTRVSKLPLLRIAGLYIHKKVFWCAVAVISMGFYAVLVHTFGFRFQITMLGDIYELREDYRASVNRIAGYSINWQSKVINTLLIAYGIANKKPGIALIGFIGQLFIFSITGHKSVLLSICMIFGFWFALRKSGKNFAFYFLLSYLGLAVISFFSAIAGSTLAVSLFVRRMIITPGMLSGFYVDFFSSHDRYHLSHSILGIFNENPYGKTPSFLMGQEYFGKSDMAANANVFADAYANFGPSGVLAFSLLLGGVLWLYDCIACSKPLIESSLFLSIAAWSLTDTALLTSLLTHGILLTLLVLYCFPKKEVERIERHHHDQFRPSYYRHSYLRERSRKSG